MALPVIDSLINGTTVSLATYSANWTTGNGSLQVTASGAQATSTASADNFAYWNADTFSNDQYAKIKIGVVGGDYGGCVVRASGTNNYYRLLVSRSPDQYQVGKMVAGSYTTLRAFTNTSASVNTDPNFELRVVGNQITVYQSGVQQGSAITDSSLTSGSAGFYSYATTALPLVSNFEGGNIVSTITGSLGQFDPEMRILGWF